MKHALRLTVTKGQIDSVRARFDKYVEKTATGCHIWRACRTSHGYGQLRVNGHTRRAHRIAWALAHGPIPRGKVVRHRCLNTSCVNVEHLKLGSQGTNVREQWRYRRAA
jgi:hypothetical protein